MYNLVDKRIDSSNKIYPIFYGLSSDLIFFIAIRTLFLTNVKELTSSEINFITTIGVLVALVFYIRSRLSLISLRFSLKFLSIEGFILLISPSIRIILSLINYHVLILWKQHKQLHQRPALHQPPLKQ